MTGKPARVKWPTSRRGRVWLVSSALLVIVGVVAALAACSSPRPASSAPSRPASPAPSRPASPAPSRPPNPAAHFHFATLPPGATLPSGAQCARMVDAVPSPPARAADQPGNGTVGQRVGPGLFPRGDSPQAALLAPLISGDFTGTTEQILLWAACKWGINQDVVFAQAAAESGWRQTHLGDWGTDPAWCPPGHGLGADGVPGQCPQSYGIMQTKYRLWTTAWPGIDTSTAMNVDVAYAIWRSCFDGYEVWLQNSAPPHQPYHPGELWGCVGRWFAGGWYTPAAVQYINRVQQLLHEQVWEQPGFMPVG